MLLTIEQCRSAVQAHVDGAAKMAGFRDIAAAMTYTFAGEVASFASRARRLLRWRSRVWKAFAEIADANPQVETAQEIIDQLPTIKAPLDWTLEELVSGGRLDALCYAGDGVVVTGSRSPSDGLIYRSTDYGATWTYVTDVSRSLGAMASGGNGIVYALTGDGYVLRSDDYGATWGTEVQVSTASPLLDSRTTRCYGIWVMPTGTILVSDTAGCVNRSTDGGANWTDLGLIATGLGYTDHAFYRFMETADGVVLNGWGGWLLKTTWAQDGATWARVAILAAEGVLIAAPEYLGNSVGIQGDVNGLIYRTEDDWDTWETADTGTYCDDFNLFSGEIAMLSRVATTGQRIALSFTGGQTWMDADVPMIESDRIDHNITIRQPGKNIVIAVTTLGYVVRTVVEWVDQPLLLPDRTTFKEDFGRYAIAAGLPSGFTVRWNTGVVYSVAAEVVADSISGKQLLMTLAGSTSQNRLLSFDDAGSFADGEVLGLVYSSSSTGSAQFIGVAMRGGGGIGTEDGYHAHLRSNSGAATQLRVGKIASGSGAALATVSAAWAVDTWCWIKLRVVGTSIKAKLWQLGDPEPGAWQVDTTDSDVSAAGYAGIYNNADPSGTDTRGVAYISVGKNAAERAPFPGE